MKPNFFIFSFFHHFFHFSIFSFFHVFHFFHFLSFSLIFFHFLSFSFSLLGSKSVFLHLIFVTISLNISDMTFNFSARLGGPLPSSPLFPFCSSFFFLLFLFLFFFSLFFLFWHQYPGLTKDVSSAASAPWRCGVFTT